jgi:hypothetical protein
MWQHPPPRCAVQVWLAKSTPAASNKPLSNAPATRHNDQRLAAFQAEFGNKLRLHQPVQVGAVAETRFEFLAQGVFNHGFAP